MVAHAGGGLGELDPELDGQVAALDGLQQPAPGQVGLVPHLGKLGLQLGS